ncbi:MAG: DeoR/GlpR family DNA-binding transcription regulator [Pirellulaceae bacterium]
MSSASSTEIRRDQLRRQIQANGFASLIELAAELQVSESTIRRDLDYLEEQGEAKRTHGGVFWTGSPANMRLFEGRRDNRWTQKRAIALAASELIQDSDTIILDGGSTTYELARLLVGRPLQVVTNSLPVANLFSGTDKSDLVLIGGYVHNRTGVTLGPYANTMLEGLNVRCAVISIAGADERGFYNSNMLLVGTEKEMLRSADETIIVADSTKFGHASLSRTCQLGDVNTVVTDDELSEPWRQRLTDAGVKLVIAGP